MTNAPVATQQSAPKLSRADRIPPWLTATGIGLVAALVVGIIAAGFIWPFKASDPKNIPFGIAAPSEQSVVLEGELGSQKPDLFDIASYADREALVEAIEKRDVVGGLVVNESGMEMLTASAGNAQIAQMLDQMAAGMKQQQAAAAQEAVNTAVDHAVEHGAPTEQVLAIQQAAQEQATTMTLRVTDVVPGGSLAIIGNLVMLPALFGGMATALLSVLLVKRPWLRIVGLASGTVLAGLMGALVLGPWMDVVSANFGMLWLALSAAMFAIAATIMGLGTLFGNAGIGIGALLVMLVGTPWGGVFVPSEFLGGFMGWLGAHTPNGNLVQLIKNISFFPEASQASQWWVFIIWAAMGLALWAVGAALGSRKQARAATA